MAAGRLHLTQLRARAEICHRRAGGVSAPAAAHLGVTFVGARYAARARRPLVTSRPRAAPAPGCLGRPRRSSPPAEHGIPETVPAEWR